MDADRILYVGPHEHPRPPHEPKIGIGGTQISP
jgi:hypothetical protein